jgi:GrpB-like predicted nucleotidyltransferase (UPF0157 family)
MPEDGEPVERIPLTEEQIRAATVGELTPLSGPIQIVDYAPQWPRLFAREAGRVQAALGDRVPLLEHTGSTAVPGLAAKPRIDIPLVVADSADELAYVPPLETAGDVLRICEPDWYEPSLFKGPDTHVTLPVFSSGCPEVDRVLLFCDHVRRAESDRRLYERTKRELTQNDWKYTQNYADAKTSIIEDIIARGWRGEGGDAGEHNWLPGTAPRSSSVRTRLDRSEQQTLGPGPDPNTTLGNGRRTS